MLQSRNLYDPGMDPKLLEAAESILGEQGIDAVSLERVAERAGRSRVTLWRQGVTKDDLITGLLQRLTDDFVEVFWPVVSSSARGSDRLADALTALFEVADRHLSLLAISDEAFHWAAERCEFPAGAHGFLGPFIAALQAGKKDDSLRFEGRSEDAADVIFNAACWGYVHLRVRHRWSRKRARAQLAAVLLRGVATA
jgi:AcrR family transcriptional regulator